MRAKASVRPHIFDDVVIHEVVKGDVFEFIGLGRRNNWMVLCESHQEWFYFAVMYMTRMTLANVKKNV